MAWLKKKPDVISDRSRELNQEIAAIEARIARLGAQVQRNTGAAQQPRLRSTAIPHGPTVKYETSGENGSHHSPDLQEPIFEDIDRNPLDANVAPDANPQHYNDLGVRKYDLPALFRRVRSHFRGPSASNPKLVSYLAAGGIHGLRPMRYEKRVARNRFIALAVTLFLILLGIIMVYVKNR